ncbi:L-lactate MFS transporter [Photobacterium carnosum]|jgi:MFS family permease|uniref:Oxalate:formate antiporter n=1 Tax=Photobacterium carnosum TaxID=2023717 RepID=A0A2N4UX35_9GAMM|nr:OFA family MFS transporter [Photobacterium carnosum]KAE8178692.1 oxalate:formate antiporter [Photobacterium carnosum]MBY3786995.1 OFA family MFS transporter [Photobacterium carnosum]MCD9515253.1 MFS transporter [Photobacterium carnosum]MCD9521345.1 MFS transporter [Photobacterium carnosum]MCD9525050.1 MFS transporter [Photobacterium carnosum]
MFDRAKQILIAGFCINLCIGILFTWSVFKKALVINLGWTNSEASLPYTVAIITFSITLLLAGILQDKFGPKLVLITGTIFAGLGLIASGYVTNSTQLIFTFGILAGGGIGFSYACLSPAAMKWFHPSKRGLVNGLITAGFGLAGVYLAPLITSLIASYGINYSFNILGVALLCIATPLAFTITNPSENYVPVSSASAVKKTEKEVIIPQTEMCWTSMLKTSQFYNLWIMYLCASSTGLMIIGNITSIAAIQADMTDAAHLVVILALFNTSGRVLAGMLCDKIGGLKTLSLSFVLSITNMLLFPHYSTHISLIIGMAIAGLCYGTLPAVFPSLTAGFYGLKNYGTNYGVVYTAWGVSGFIGPVIAASAVDTTGNYQLAYFYSTIIMAIAFVFSLFTKNPKKQSQTEPNVMQTRTKKATA